MGATTVAHHPNGRKPAAAAQIIPLMGPKADRLLDLRASLKQLQEEERALTGELVRTLQAQGLQALAGSCAIAVLDQRTTLKVDPELFHQVVGPAAFTALTVSLSQARKLMGEEDLAAISETTISPVLRVEPIPAPAA